VLARWVAGYRTVSASASRPGRVDADREETRERVNAGKQKTVALYARIPGGLGIRFRQGPTPCAALRAVREMVDEVFEGMSPRFIRLYTDVGRPAIAPERRLQASLLQIFYFRVERVPVVQQLQLQPAVPLVCGSDVVFSNPPSCSLN